MNDWRAGYDAWKTFDPRDAWEDDRDEPEPDPDACGEGYDDGTEDQGE